MTTAMVICPHADDAAAFCGATLAKFAAEGWRIVLVRVTNDSKDSVGLSQEETILRNTEELHAAAKILGVAEIIELGYETDCLADAPMVPMRERFVYLFRKYRPYAVFSFDPFGLYEGNMDHIRVAQAVEEAFWVSCFDKHHPEHFEEGLAPFSVCERWYFGRNLPGANHAEDVSEYLEKKVEALCAHREMMRNTINQLRLQAQTFGRRLPLLDMAMEGDLRPLLALVMQEQANAVARTFNLGEGRMGEVFRLERFGDMEEFVQALSEPIPGAEQAPKRERFDAQKTENGQTLSPEHTVPSNLNQRVGLMGHHHLCAGAFEELFQMPAFRAAYADLVDRLQPSPDLQIETLFGYDIFCYHCEYWSNEEGRCSTGWKNKISKDAAVLEHLGLRPGQVTRFEDLQRLLAAKISDADLKRFCSVGEWKCEMYILGACQKAYQRLRDRFGGQP